MSEYIAGSVAAEVVPDARKFAALLGKQVSPAADSLGKKIGQDLADRISRGIRDGMANGWRTAVPSSQQKGRESGDAFAGAFDREVRTKITAALKALPKAQIGASATEAEQKIKDLRNDLATLGDKKIGIDIDAGAALAELDRIKVALSQVEADSADIQVRADVGAALAELNRVKSAARDVANESPTIRVDADTAGARAQLASVGSAGTFAAGGVSSLVLAAAAIAPAIIPAAAAAAAALAGLGAIAGAAVAGIGFGAFAFSGITDAVKALGKAQDEAGVKAASSAAKQVVSTASIRSAEMSLRDARASAAEGAARSAQAIVSAQRGVVEAQRSAAEASVRSAQTIADAQRGVVDAQRAAADGVQSALARVTAAEETHTRSVESARLAQMSLNDAREDARRSLEDLEMSLISGQLAERGALLAIQRAREAYNEDPDAQSKLDYDEAIHRLEEVRLRNERLAQEKAEADKAGIKGSAQVVAAQKRIADAQRAEADAAKGVKEAQAGVVEAREDGARRISDAQERVTRATSAAAIQQRQSAESIIRAQEAVAQASVAAATQQRQSASSVERAQAGVVQAQEAYAKAQQAASAETGKLSAAQRDLALAMGGLSPAGAKFAQYLFDLKKPIQELRAEVQEGLFPGLMRGMDAAGKALAPFKGTLRAVGEVLGDLAESAGKALGSPFWQGVIAMFSGALPGVIRTLGGIVGDIATGFAGMAKELWGSGVTGGVLGGLKTLSERFSDFGTGKTDGLGKFIAYAKENGPKVVAFLSAAGGAIVAIGVALTPAGGKVLELLTGLFRRVADMDPAQIQQIAGSIVGIMVAIKTASGITSVVGFFGALAGLGPVGLILAGVSAGLLAIGGAAFYAYTTNEDFRRSADKVVAFFRDELMPQFKIAEGIIRQGLSDAVSILTSDVGSNKSMWSDLGTLLRVSIVPAAEVISGALAVMAVNVKSLTFVVGLLWAQYEFFGSVMVSVGTVAARAFLALVGTIIQGAADAFGWVPGIGPKLEAAADKFGTFKDGVNAALNGINDKKVNIGVEFKAGSRLAYDLQHQGFADGGLVKGLPGRAGGGVIPGPWRGPKADNVLGVTDAGVPIARVNPREYITRVWATDRMERKHPGAMAYINQFGELPSHALGGRLSMPTSESRRRAIDDATLDYVAKNADSLRKAFGSTAPGAPVAGGGVGMGYKAQMAWVAANIPGVTISSTLRTGDPLSYHDQGRAIDMYGGPGKGAIFDKIKASFAIPNIAQLYYSPKGNQQVRYGKVMNTPPHIFNEHFDHVHWGMANGGLVPRNAGHYAGVFDTGGTLNPGRNIVDNFTGAKERLIRADAPAMPRELVVVDVDGHVSMRMRVAARQELSSTASKSRRQGVTP